MADNSARSAKTPHLQTFGQPTQKPLAAFRCLGDRCRASCRPSCSSIFPGTTASQAPLGVSTWKQQTVSRWRGKRKCQMRASGRHLKPRLPPKRDCNGACRARAAPSRRAAWKRGSRRRFLAGEACAHRRKLARIKAGVMTIMREAQTWSKRKLSSFAVTALPYTGLENTPKQRPGSSPVHKITYGKSCSTILSFYYYVGKRYRIVITVTPIVRITMLLEERINDEHRQILPTAAIASCSA